MNLSTEQKQTHRHREQTCGCQGEGGGEGWTGGLGLEYTQCVLWDGWPKGTCCTAQGILPNIL